LAVYAFHLYPNLAEEIHWILSVMKSRGLDKSSAEKLIETWTIAIHGLIKPSDADELARPLSWARARVPELWNVLSSSEDESPADVKKFLELALRGRRRDAADHVLSLSKRGCPPEKICDDVFFPALKQIGLLWQHNKVSAADEHAATDIIRYVMFRLFDGSLREPRLSFKAVLSCVPGDEHEIGAEMMAGFLDLKGWSVLFLGRSSPAEDILKTVSGRHPDAIFLVLSLIEYLPEAHGLILSIRKNAPHAKIILAGAAAAAAKNILDQISDGIVIGLEEGYSTATRLVSSDA
jgi:methanogenic corrinoid protein MtbC1